MNSEYLQIFSTLVIGPRRASVLTQCCGPSVAPIVHSLSVFSNSINILWLCFSTSWCPQVKLDSKMGVDLPLINNVDVSLHRECKKRLRTWNESRLVFWSTRLKYCLEMSATTLSEGSSSGLKPTLFYTSCPWFS